MSADAATCTELTAPPWNVTDPSAVKYDFDAVSFVDAEGVEQIVTVGGDRATFDFTDPEDFLRVDNDVWTFAPPEAAADD